MADGNQTYCSDHFIKHKNKSLCTAETYTLFPIDDLQLTEVQIVLEKKKIELPYDLVIQFWKQIQVTPKGICTPLFTALFPRDKTQNQPNCPLMDE